MAYIGNTPALQYITHAKQTLTADSSTVAFTLSQSVANENELEVFVNNVRQEPGSGKAYTASGTTLTMSEAPTTGDGFYCIYQGKATQTVTPGASTVTNDMLTGSIANAKLANSSITLNSSAVSLGGSHTIANTPAFEASFNSQANPSDNTWTKGLYGSEEYDTDSKYDTSNYRFTPGTAGKYYVYMSVIFDAQGVDRFHSATIGIYKNGSIYRQSYFDQYDNYLAYAKTPYLAASITMNTTDYVEAWYNFNFTTGAGRINTGGVFGAFKLIGV